MDKISRREFIRVSALAAAGAAAIACAPQQTAVEEPTAAPKACGRGFRSPQSPAHAPPAFVSFVPAW